MQPRAQSIAARKKRAVVDSDDEEEEVQQTVKPKPEPEDDDAMEEDFPVDGDRQDRYQQSRLRDEARFAAAQRSERVVSDKSDDMDMDDFLERPTGEPDFDDAASDTSSSADEIVEELDVYINQNLANKLFLFQYPLRSKDFSEDLTPRSGRIKPGAKMVEVNVPLDTGSHTYDRFKGEELAETAGEGGGQSAAHILGRSKGKTKLLDTQIYNSTPVPTSATYFAGVVDGLGLHLTPIRSVVQLRPNLAYLNKSKEKPKTGPGSDQPGPAGDDGSAQPARVLQVSVRKNDLSENKDENARRQTEHDQRRKAEEESWTSLTIHPPTSHESDSAKNLLILHDMEVEDAEMVGSSGTYLDEVAPRVAPSTREVREGPQILRGLTLAEIRTYPLPEQLKCMMINANIMRYSKIREYVSPYYSEERILEELPKVATLVRGCWAVRSSIIYKDRPAAARQLLLRMFNETEHVTRQQLIEKTHMPLQMATAMLQELAVSVPGKGWELRTGHDEAFVREHEHLAAKIKLAFEKEVVLAERDLLAKTAHKKSTTSPVGKSSVPGTPAASQHKRQSSLETVKPTVPAPTAGSTSSSPGVFAVPEPRPPKGKEKDAGKPAGPSSSSLKVAVPKDVKVYTESPVPAADFPILGTTAIEQTRYLIRQILNKHGVVQTSIIKSYLWARANDSDAADNVLRPADITDTHVRSVLDEITVAIGDSRVLKHVDTNTDPQRDAVIDLLRCKNGASVKKQDVTNAVQAKGLEAMTATVYSKVMKELAVSSGANWTMKSGDPNE